MIAYLSNARGPTDVWVKFIAGGDTINLTAKAKLECSVASRYQRTGDIPRWIANRLCRDKVSRRG